MGLADEDLRKGRARAGPIPHLFSERRIGGDIVFGEGGFFASQQRCRGGAIAAARTGVDLDHSGHVALLVWKPLIIWELYECPQPGRTPARRPMLPWRAAAPARRRPRWR